MTALLVTLFSVFITVAVGWSKLMSALDDIKALVVRLQAAITNVAGDIKTLSDKIPGTDSIGQAEALALKQQLETLTTQLEAAAALTPDSPPEGGEEGGASAASSSRRSR